MLYPRKVGFAIAQMESGYIIDNDYSRLSKLEAKGKMTGIEEYLVQSDAALKEDVANIQRFSKKTRRDIKNCNKQRMQIRLLTVPVQYHVQYQARPKIIDASTAIEKLKKLR